MVRAPFCILASGGDIWTKKKGRGHASEAVADGVWDGQFA